LAETTISTPSDALAQQRRIEHRQQRRRVDDDELVLFARVTNQLLEADGPEQLMDGRLRRAGRDDVHVERSIDWTTSVRRAARC
jgi:hypothetical protein